MVWTSERRGSQRLLQAQCKIHASTTHSPTIRQSPNGIEQGRLAWLLEWVHLLWLLLPLSCPAAYKETGCTCQAANLSRRVLQRADRHNSPLAPGRTSLTSGRRWLHQHRSRNRPPNYRSPETLPKRFICTFRVELRVRYANAVSFESNTRWG